MSSNTNSKSLYLKTVDGNENLPISEIGLGTIAWGDESYGFNKQYREKDLKETYRKAREIGLNFFDTAEVYGFGKSEELLAEFAKDVGAGVETAPALATKFAPIPFRWSAEDVPKALEASLKRLGVSKVALYMQHWPAFGLPGVTEACNDAFLEGLCLCYEQGLCRAVGVSNFNVELLDETIATAAEHRPCVNQVEVHPGNRNDALRAACAERGVVVEAYAPLGTSRAQSSADGPSSCDAVAPVAKQRKGRRRSPPRHPDRSRSQRGGPPRGRPQAAAA